MAFFLSFVVIEFPSLFALKLYMFMFEMKGLYKVDYESKDVSFLFSFWQKILMLFSQIGW